MAPPAAPEAEAPEITTAVPADRTGATGPGEPIRAAALMVARVRAPQPALLRRNPERFTLAAVAAVVMMPAVSAVLAAVAAVATACQTPDMGPQARLTPVAAVAAVENTDTQALKAMEAPA